MILLLRTNQRYHWAMKRFPLLAALVMTLVPMSAVAAQEFRSPEVHDDRSVTFRLKSGAAKEVLANVDGSSLQLVKGEKDIWSVTTSPLAPGIHDYSFEVDGTRMIDPSNRNVKKWFTLASMVEIPGTPPLLTEFQNVPHGVVQQLIYTSKSVGHSRPVIVYTPPGYTPISDETYPLIILMHGFGDDESAWTDVGRVHLIADNLLAAGKIKRCVIAMPYGHPVPPPFGKRPENYFAENNDLYEKDITADLLPFLESEFKVRSNAEDRSIVGLSMGGGHAIDTGLKNIDKFSSIGAFSAAAPQAEKDGVPVENLAAKYPAMFGPNPSANKLQHFFIPIGDRDFLLDRNQQFVSILNEQGVRHEFKMTSGGHEWKLWRDYVAEFLQMVVGTTD